MNHSLKWNIYCRYEILSKMFFATIFKFSELAVLHFLFITKQLSWTHGINFLSYLQIERFCAAAAVSFFNCCLFLTLSQLHCSRSGFLLSRLNLSHSESITCLIQKTLMVEIIQLPQLPQWVRVAFSTIVQYRT